MSMELQMRMDPSWRKLRSYSSMANTQRKCASQLPTLDGRLSSSDTHGLPITTQKLTGLARVSPCLDALLSVVSLESPERIGSYYMSLERYFQGQGVLCGLRWQIKVWKGPCCANRVHSAFPNIPLVHVSGQPSTAKSDGRRG